MKLLCLNTVKNTKFDNLEGLLWQNHLCNIMRFLSWVFGHARISQLCYSVPLNLDLILGIHIELFHVVSGFTLNKTSHGETS